MVFYYVVCDVAGPVDGFKPGRTLIRSCRTSDSARLDADRLNRLFAKPGAAYLVIPHDADRGGFECDYYEPREAGLCATGLSSCEFCGAMVRHGDNTCAVCK